MTCRSGGVIVAGAAAPGRGRCRCWPATTSRLLAAARVRRDRAGHRRDRSRPPEHHHPADPVAGRRDRAAPAGHLPAARDLAGRTARSCSGLATFMHAAGITCSQRLGDLLAALDPAGEADRGRAARGGPAAMIPLRRRWRRSSTAPASRRGSRLLLPIGVRARQLLVRTLLLGMLLCPGRSPARAPDPGPPGTDHACPRPTSGGSA